MTIRSAIPASSTGSVRRRRTFPRPGALALAILFALALAQTAPHPATAQEPTPIDADQQVTIRYGDTLVFDLDAQPPAPVVTAQLAILLDGQDTPHIEGLPLAETQQVSLTAEVAVEALSLPPVAGLTYWWELIDPSGQRFRTTPQPFRYEDTIVPWSWEASERGSVTVHTDGTSRDVLDASFDLATRAQSEASRLLAAPAGDLHVYVYPELSLLAASLRRHNLSVSDWVAAYAVPSQHTILVAAAPGPDMMATLSRDIPHEVYHVVVASAAGDAAGSVPGWLTEGLAIAAEGTPDPTLTAALDEAIRTQSLLPLETLCVPRFTGFAPQQATLAYAQSGSLVRYLLDRYGTSAIRAYITALRNGESCSGAAAAVFGVSLAGVETQWHNALLSQAARTPQNADSVLPWLAVWGISMMLAILFVAPQPERRSG